jgi:hypothetical protein
MMRLKPEVRPEGVCREIWYAIGVAAALKGGSCVVTSLTDGQHNPGSKHPSGNAVDFRIRDMNNDAAIAWFNALKAHLDPMGFDVCFEGGVGATPATTGAHIHCEFDPKPGESFIHTV